MTTILITIFLLQSSFFSGILSDNLLFSNVYADENASAIIINHETTRLSEIPEEWIEKAKTDLHIVYEHTSHGSQITTGMTGLVGFKGSLYAWNGGGSNGALDLRDRPSGAGDLGNSRWPEVTRNYLNTHPEVNVVMWSWCGQVSSASESYINTYLNNMNTLESEYPDVKFVYMTGHLNGTGLNGNLHIRNEQIRDYCETNNKILYDFADIESYDPDGAYFLDKAANDACAYDTDGNGTRDGNWAIEWQNSHVKGVDWYEPTSAHSQPLNANLKAYGAWWLWARLAGWDGGESDETPPTAPQVNGVVAGQTYATAVTPVWVDETGTTSTATLVKDGGNPLPYNSGVALNENGNYTLEVTSTNISNGLTATTAISFSIMSQSIGEWNISDFDNVYEVGPGLAYETPNDVPWESLQPSSIVRIHWRQEPYRSKWVITTTATIDQPVVVIGVPNNGMLPVITGENATTREGMYYLTKYVRL